MFFNNYIQPIFDCADIIWGDRGNVALMKQLQVLLKEAGCIILDLPLVHQPLRLEINLRRKLLSRRCAEHRGIFMFKCLNNLFTHPFKIVLNREHNDSIQYQV